MTYSVKRGLLYGLAAFLTTLVDEIVPVLREGKWPDPQSLVVCAIIGTLSVVLILRAFIDGSVARSANGSKPMDLLPPPPPPPPSPPPSG